MKSYTCPHCKVRYVNLNDLALEAMVRAHLTTHPNATNFDQHKKLFSEYREVKRKKRKRNREKQKANNDPKATSAYIKQLELRNRRLTNEIKVLKSKLESGVKNISSEKKETSFYESRAWQKLRYKVLGTYGRKCMSCNTTDARFHIDHIKPRSKYPHLELDIDNLQVLCEACNLGKSNLDETDFRRHKNVL